MVLDVEFVAGWASAIAAIFAPGWVVMRRVSSFIERLKNLESWTDKQQADIDKGRKEKALLLAGTLACLKCHQKNGHNGPVTDSIKEIEEFLLEQATMGRSESKRD